VLADVKDRPGSGRPLLHPEEDNALGRLVTCNMFANSTALKRQWLPHRLLSARTDVIGQLMFASNTTNGRVVMTNTLGNLHQ
jgi:hypothetical protein